MTRFIGIKLTNHFKLKALFLKEKHEVELGHIDKIIVRKIV